VTVMTNARSGEGRRGRPGPPALAWRAGAHSSAPGGGVPAGGVPAGGSPGRSAMAVGASQAAASRRWTVAAAAWDDGEGEVRGGWEGRWAPVIPLKGPRGTTREGRAAVRARPLNVRPGLAISNADDRSPLGEPSPASLVRPRSGCERGLSGETVQVRLVPVRRRCPRTFFWRRALVVCGIALFGAAAWAAGESLFAATHLAGSSGPASTAGLVDGLALASVEGPMGSSPGARGPVAAGARDQRQGSAPCVSGGPGRGEPAPSRQCLLLYVARPGDTIWDIALRYSGGADPRALADALEAEIGGGVLQPGQVLSIR